MDNFYKSVVKLYGEGDLADAGYLDCDYWPSTEIRADVTPFHKVMDNLRRTGGTGRKKAIVFTTGGFSPVHTGHVEILEIARRAVEAHGYDVVGGFLSPSHDAYVDIKDEGRAKCHAGTRVIECAKFVADGDWIAVDPWESRYLKRDVNFTTVYERLAVAASWYWNEGISVFYVFGADNAGFAKAFAENGYAVCVNRPGYNHRYLQAKGDTNLFNGRVLFADEPTSDVSSTEIRNRTIPMGHTYKDDGFTLFLRYDHVAVADGAKRARYLEFSDDLLKVFNKLLPFRVRKVNAKKQIEIAADTTLRNMNVISMDPLWRAEHNLAISRVFAPSDAQIAPIGYVNRPGSPSLSTQVAAIPDGEYVLVDDDICTGGSVRFAQSLLPDSVKITKAYSLLHLTQDVGRNYDVVDVRDFVFDAPNGGLVVGFGTKITRVPYVSPIVSLASRASVPPELEHELSLRIINLNEFYDIFDGQTMENVGRLKRLLEENKGR